MAKTDIDIAREATLKPIQQIADRLNIPDSAIEQYGKDKAKIQLDYIDSLPEKTDSKLILVTAISPTPAGEGKTTTTVGLGDGLNRIGKNTIMCLREPSLGPCFGVKGGAAGGGYAQVVPMEAINLHFTGDFHAIGIAHNLLSALIDNHIYWGNKLDIDQRRVSWRRVMDMNDRALRQITASLGGVANGFPREAGFDITVASEVMAIFCLSKSLQDLETRLGNIIIGQNRKREPIRAHQLNAHKAMTVVLKDALMPNLVQTLEHNPAFIHGGPFANIAHGCNSIIATKTALKLADYVVTEAGFGADLGAEKFLDIKCRKAGLKPNAVVLVATIRALKMHGGVDKKQLQGENIDAVKKGTANLRRHIENLQKYNVPIVVAINHFVHDTDAELEVVKACCNDMNVPVSKASHWAEGGAGTEELAHKVVALAEAGVSKYAPLYGDDVPLWDKISTIAKEIYRASEVTAPSNVRAQIKQYQDEGYGHYPICVAKTQYSFSTDPALLGAPDNHSVNVREVRLAAGAEFIVAICGDIMTMPGLPSVPSAEKIMIDDDGLVQGLF